MTSTLLERTAAAPTTARPVRDPWFDNAKMTLATLVVVGHLWSLLPETVLSSWAYNFLYLWHVPAFVMVTGYLSRSFSYSRRNLSRLLTTVALPYVVFEALLAGFRTIVGGEHLGPLWIDPHWPMWYLSALFLWRLVTPVLRRSPHPVLLAVAVSLLAGLTSGDTLDLERTLALLPFFVVGLHVTPGRLERLRSPSARRLAVAAFVTALAFAGLVEGTLGSEWLYWRSSYAETGMPFLDGALVRLGLVVAGLVLAASFFALLPRRGGWYARMGSASLVVYLFHGFAVKSVEYSAFPEWAGQHLASALVLSVVGAAGLALLLASPRVASRLRVVVDPVGTWRRETPEGRAPSGPGLRGLVRW
jgi:fucose 4-O-acetylase-like acetyltransferase